MKISVNGSELAYDDHGTGLPVIFLHAFPLNRTMWADLIRALLPEQQYRLIALDWRGFGESSGNQEPLTMETCADDLMTLMDQLGIQQAVLCGLSMGGYAAFAFWRKYPERVRALIFADTRPQADSSEGRANRETVARLVEEQGMAPLIDLQIPKLLSAFTRQRHPEVEARVRQLMASAPPAGVAAASRGMAQRKDSSDLLAGITCPTLVLVGEDDTLTTPEVALNYADQIPDARFTTIPHASHLSNLEQPEAFLNTVRSFLATL